ncbi:MAG: serine/threonine protein kinase [Myxococcales bacterium]|nr:serine/threonine protein kinase [Myxococcales bacterium]
MAALDDSFFSLTPERVLAAVEVGGRRATGRVLALNSLENRVYEVELEEGERLVAKFYRPARWSREAILEEHALLAELLEAELPVVPPIDLGGGATLGDLPGDGGAIHYAVFPKARGRAPEELTDEQLAQLGRLVARLHHVGSRRAATPRPTLTPESYGAASVRLLTSGPWIPHELLGRFVTVAEELIAACARAFARSSPETIRLHGDCHLGNLLWGSSGPFFLDFDDFLAGPPVQDLWLLVPGHDAEALRQRAVLTDAYRSMRALAQGAERLVEPLRALRILRYSAWIAQRYRDPAFPRTFPDFLEHTWWQREIGDLGLQLGRVNAVVG